MHFLAQRANNLELGWESEELMTIHHEVSKRHFVKKSVGFELISKLDLIIPGFNFNFHFF